MRSKPGPPMTLANMRQNGVRAVSATCQACGHKADISVDALPETLTVPEAGKRFRCGSCGGKTISTRPAWHTAQRQGVVFLGSVEPNAGAPSPRSDWAPGGPDSGLCPKPAQDGGVARRQTAALSLIDQIGSPCVRRQKAALG
jgi:hypothetical protein